MIAAVSQNGVIGQDNTIPWGSKYPEDMNWFRKITAPKTVGESITESVVIMGRKTWESIGKKLPKRRNIVITKTKIEMEGIETYPTISVAMSFALSENINNNTILNARDKEELDVWFIGGTSIYKEGMEYADEIYITKIPDIIEGENLTYFPEIDTNKFEVKEHLPLYNAEGKQTLNVVKYVRHNLNIHSNEK